MLRGKATLPLWFEPSHNYVGPAVTEIIYGPVGLIRAGFSPVGLFLGRKSKIFHEQNVKEFLFYIRMPNFRLLGSIIMKKKYLKVADPLNLKMFIDIFCWGWLHIAMYQKLINLLHKLQKSFANIYRQLMKRMFIEISLLRCTEMFGRG